MSLAVKIPINVLAVCVVALSSVACSNDSAEYDRPLRNDGVTERRPEVRPEDIKVPESEDLSATVHRTITFAGDSSELDQAAEKSLEGMVNALNEDLTTQVTVRTVDANDVSAGDASRLSAERAEAVKEYLLDQGIEVADIRVDKFSAREFQSSMTDQDQQNQSSPEHAVNESMDNASSAERSAEQEVIITVVSTGAQ